jgi:hypothetical protein
LACGSAGSQKRQSTRSCPQNGELVAGAPAVAVDASLTIPDQQLRQRAQRPQTATDPGEQIGRLLAEDQGASTGARVAQARDDDPALPGVPVTDGNLLLGLPDIELADLPRPIHGALERPRPRREQRAHLAKVVIDDRLAARKAQRRDQFPDALARQLRISLQQPMDLILERVEL